MKPKPNFTTVIGIERSNSGFRCLTAHRRAVVTENLLVGDDDAPTAPTLLIGSSPALGKDEVQQIIDSLTHWHVTGRLPLSL